MALEVLKMVGHIRVDLSRKERGYIKIVLHERMKKLVEIPFERLAGS